MTDTRKHLPIGGASLAVAAHVRSNRRARGWSQEELANRMTEAGWPMTTMMVGKLEANLNDLDKRGRRITVDDLVAFAQLFNADPASMLTAPECDTCNGAPPVGFTCQTCGRGTQ